MALEQNDESDMIVMWNNVYLKCLYVPYPLIRQIKTNSSHIIFNTRIVKWNNIELPCCLVPPTLIRHTAIITDLNDNLA